MGGGCAEGDSAGLETGEAALAVAGGAAGGT